MAKITLASPISGIRGKVGGLIYSANKAGPYLKTWSRGSNPRSFIQTGHRAKLIDFSITWSTLSASEKTGWITYAALPAQDLVNSLGETYSISGFNWFIRINLNRESSNDGLTTTAPTGGTPATPDVESLLAFSTADSSNTRIRLTASSPGLGERIVIKAVLVYSQGNEASPQIRTFMRVRQRDIIEQNFAFKEELLEHFGTAQIGQKVFALVYQQSSEGRRSAPASGVGDITS